MSHFDDFVARFGEDEAQRIVDAASKHENGLHGKRGSDGFRWALLICIGYECMSKDSYRKDHGITTPWDDLNEWMLARPEWFSEHDGDVDFLSLACGVYQPYVGLEAPA